MTLHLHILNDGRRIIEAPDIERLFQAWANGAPLTMHEAEIAAHFKTELRVG